MCADAPLAGASQKPAARSNKPRTLERAPLTAANIEALVVPGDLGPDTLGQLYRTCQEVYLPLMSNAENQHGWPDVVTRELLDGFQRAVAGIYVTIGQVQGKTLLPLPPTSSVEVAVDNKKVDKERVHVLETAAVTWSRQIKAVLKTEPEQVLVGPPPRPVGRARVLVKQYNLASIREQLASDKFRKVMRVLDLTKSTYYPAFARLCKRSTPPTTRPPRTFSSRSARCWTRCSRRSLRRSPRRSAGLHDLPDLEREGHYNTPARLVVLVRMCCNTLIERARRHVTKAIPAAARSSPRCSTRRRDARVAHRGAPRLRHLQERLLRLQAAVTYPQRRTARVGVPSPARPRPLTRPPGPPHRPPARPPARPPPARPPVAHPAPLPHPTPDGERRALPAAGRLPRALPRRARRLCRTVAGFGRLEKIEVGGNQGRALSTSDLGLKGDLSISEPMETLMLALYDDKVPETWAARAWPSLARSARGSRTRRGATRS